MSLWFPSHDRYGWLETENGTFVGDIPSIRIYIEGDLNITLLIQGRVSRTGNWDTIGTLTSQLTSGSIDIREYEFLRIDASLLNGITSTRVVVFGYTMDARDLDQPVISTERDFKVAIETNDTLKQVHIELQKLNAQMALITGEEL